MTRLRKKVVDKLEEMICNGYINSEISEKTSVSLPTIRKIRKRLENERGLETETLKKEIETEKENVKLHVTEKDLDAKVDEAIRIRVKQLLNEASKGDSAGLETNLGSQTLLPVSDADKLRIALDNLSPAELRLRLKNKSGGVENQMLTAFQYMESEMATVDIMDELNIDFDKMIDFQTKYNKMKELELERQQLREPYLKAWFDVAKVFGEVIRRNCTHYNEVSGICSFWVLDEVSKTYRSTYKTLFRADRKKGGGYYVNVEKHPEACAICSIGMIKKETGAT